MTAALALLYALQSADARASAQAHACGGYEATVIMQPFSHGGTRMMLAGFALQDVVLARLTRHWSQRAQTALTLVRVIDDAAALHHTEQTRGALCP